MRSPTGMRMLERSAAVLAVGLLVLLAQVLGSLQTATAVVTAATHTVWSVLSHPPRVDPSRPPAYTARASWIA